MRNMSIFALAIIALSTHIFAETSDTVPAYHPDSVECVIGQKRWDFHMVDGYMESLDSLWLALFYITPTNDTLPFVTEAQEDTFFTLTTTLGETLHVGKVDTVMGEAPMGMRAWIVKFTGYKIGDTLKIKVINEEWDNSFLGIWDADTNYYPLGTEASGGAGYRGAGHPTTYWAFITDTTIITWDNIELSVEEMDKIVKPGDLKILTYPNPVNSVVNIPIRDANSDLKLTFMDGRTTEIPLKMRNGILRLDLSNMPSGIVIVNYTDSKGRVHRGEMMQMK